MSEQLSPAPAWMRAWHGINGLLCLLLVATGISMQYSNESSLLIRFRIAMGIHNVCGMVLIVNYLVCFIASIASGRICFFAINPRRDWRGVIQQAKYYCWGIFKGESEPFPVDDRRRYNPLQRYAYATMLYVILPLIMFTGVGLLIPDLLINNVWGKSGFILTILVHAITGFALSMFIPIHLYFAFLGSAKLREKGH